MSKENTSAENETGKRDKYGMTADNWQAFDALTDEDIAAAAATDPDCPPPMTPEQLSRMRRVSFARHVRQKLGMSREAFAAGYGIPPDTLAAWERHEAKPTQVELAYLRLIEREPELARLVAAASPSPATSPATSPALEPTP